MASDGENKSAPASKSWGVRAVLKKIGWGLIFIFWGLGFWRWYLEHPLSMLIYASILAIMLGLYFLVTHSSAVTAFFWNRKHYRAAEFVLSRLTANRDQNIQAQRLLGDIYFYGLGREKNWEIAAIHYELALLLDTAVQKAIFEALDPEMAADMRTHWPVPACLLNLQEIADNDNPQAARFLAYWAQSILP